MRSRPLAVLLIVTLLFGTQGCGGGAATPEAAFEQAKTAAKNRNWKAYTQCLTPESQEAMAGMLMFAGGMMQAFGSLGGGEGQEQAEKVKKVFEKHGLSESKLKSIGEMGPGAAGSSMDGMRNLAESIKDPAGFVADMMEALANEEMLKKSNPFDTEANLTDVKIDGDSATGTLSMAGQAGPTTMHFKKVKGQWRIDLMAMMPNN